MVKSNTLDESIKLLDPSKLTDEDEDEDAEDVTLLVLRDTWYDSLNVQVSSTEVNLTVPMDTMGAGGGSLIIVSPTTSSDCGPGPFELNAWTMTAYLVPLLRSVIFTSKMAGAWDRSSSDELEAEEVGDAEFELPMSPLDDAEDDEMEEEEDEGLGKSESTVMVLKI